MNEEESMNIRCQFSYTRNALLFPLAPLLVCLFLLLAPASHSQAPSGTQSGSAQNAEASDAEAGDVEPGNVEPGEDQQRRTTAVELIREDQLVGLPLNGRSYSNLATLQTGVSDSSGANAQRGVGGGNLSVAGGRSTSNIYLMDGTNIQNAGNSAPRSAAGVQLGSDAVLQVQVYGTTYSAEYGRGSGGVLNSITRSGTDEFHGTLFEFFRNSKLDAQNFFDGGEKPPFKRNQFGGLISGPLVRGKTYIMGSYEAMRDRLTDTDISFAPTTEARTTGILRDCDFPGDVDEISIHPSMAPYLALYTPNNGAVRGCGVGETVGNGFQPVDEDFFVVRVDHQLTERDSSFLRYSFDDAKSVSRGSLFAFRNLRETRQQYLTLVTSHIFSPSAINAFRFSYTRPVSRTRDDSDVPIPANLNFVPGVEQFGLIHVDGLTDYGPNNSVPEFDKTNTFQFSDDFVLQRGPHSLKFGAQMHRYRWDSLTSTAQSARWEFNSVESLLQAGPTATNNLVVAVPGSNGNTAFRQTLAGVYLQDAWRLSPQLDLNLGLRYEFANVINEKDGRSAALVDIVNDSAPLVGTLMKDNPSLTNFSPRVGIVWAPWQQRDTVISSGFGIFHDQILYYLIEPVKNVTPFYDIAFLSNIKTQDVFPNAIDASSGADIALSTKTLDYNNIQLPSVLRYHFTIQQPLGMGWNLRVGHVGTRGNHLMRGYEANNFPAPIRLADGSLCFPPDATTPNLEINPDCSPVSPTRAGPINPAFNSVELFSTDAQSFYNSLQLSLRKQPARGMSVQASYTLAKSIDDASGPSRDTLEYGLDRSLNRGLSNGSQLHRLSLNYFLSSPTRAGSSLLNRLVGGWRLGGIVSFRTGSPFSARLAVRRPGYLFSASRPNLAPGADNNPTNKDRAPCAEDGQVGVPRRYFSACAFELPAPGTIGNVGRNTMITPSVFQADVSLQREFILGGEKRFQFRMEMFNVPNHPSFGSPPTGSQFVFTGSSGQVNGRIGRITRTATTSRQLQFALRLSF